MVRSVSASVDSAAPKPLSAPKTPTTPARAMAIARRRLPWFDARARLIRSRSFRLTSVRASEGGRHGRPCGSRWDHATPGDASAAPSPSQSMEPVSAVPAPTSSTNTSSRRRPPRSSSVGALGDDPTLVDDGDPVADPLDHLHHVAREHHRVARGGEPLEHRADRTGRHRVDRLERLVEEQHRRARAAGRRRARSSCACRCCSRRRRSSAALAGRAPRAARRPARPRRSGAMPRSRPQ